MQNGEHQFRKKVHLGFNLSLLGLVIFLGFFGWMVYVGVLDNQPYPNLLCGGVLVASILMLVGSNVALRAAKIAPDGRRYKREESMVRFCLSIANGDVILLIIVSLIIILRITLSILA